MNESDTTPPVRGRPLHKWRSGHWKAMCGLLTMIAAVAVVWAIMASITVMQRERDLAKATEDLTDLRADLHHLESQLDPNQSVNALLDDYLTPPPEPEDELDDEELLDLLEQELEAVTDEE